MKIKSLFKRGKIVTFVAFLGIAAGSFVLGMNLPRFKAQVKETQTEKKTEADAADYAKVQSAVLPQEGFTLPISWGDLGSQLVDAGVIDKTKFEQAVQMTNEQKKILAGEGDIPVTINSQNSQFVVDLLWAVGLAQKSIIYDEGPMGTQYKDQIGNFASTGGWGLAKGDATKYLNKFNLIPLTPDQQKRVGDIAKNVYRPCCDNPTWFPDCNHGMAALAAIEMMVSKGMSDDEIYRNILKLNSFWFPDSYLTVAVYYERQGIPWEKVDAKTVLGKDFSSGSGARKLQSIVGPLPKQNNGGSCGA